MKEQYVGDINDYRKYALLRVLSSGGDNRIGVCWMLTPSDGSTDGSKRAFLQQPERHRHFDPDLFDILAHVAAEPNRRRLQTIEDSGTIPGACYFNSPLSDNAGEREAYMAACRAALADVDLAFFDPDNGLQVKAVRLGWKGSSKYLHENELAAFYATGKSVLVYQHFPFIKKDVFIASCIERLRAIAPDAVIGTFRTAHVVFLLLIHPRSPSRITDAAREAASRWDPKFITGTLSEPADTEPALAVEETEAAATVNRMPPPADEMPPAGDEQSEAEPRRPSLIRRLIARLR